MARHDADLPRCTQAQQRELEHLGNSLKQQLTEAYAREQVVRVVDPEAEGGARYCFVHFEVTPDMKGLKALFGLKSSAKSNCCAGCTVTYKELQDGYEGQKAERLDLLQAVWPALPRSRWRFCVLHGLCRVTEKMLHQMTHSVWWAEQHVTSDADKATVKKVKQSYEKVLAEQCKVMGGNFKVGIVTKVRGTRESKELGKASLNGGDARLVLGHVTRIEEALQPLADLFAADAQYSTMVSNRKLAWTAWAKCQRWFHQLHMTGEDYEQAEQDLRAFAAAYRRTTAEENKDKICSITHYIHVLEKHPDWFLGKGSPMAPALVSTQMMEHLHKFRNTTLARSTLHGMKFTMPTHNGPQVVDEAPECWQLLLKAYREHHWRLAERAKQLKAAQHTIDIAQLQALTDWHVTTITNDIMCQALGLCGTKPVHITGRGASHNTCTGITFVGCHMTLSAMKKLLRVGNTVDKDANVVTDNGHRLETDDKPTKSSAGRKRSRALREMLELDERTQLQVDLRAGQDYQYEQSARKRQAASSIEDELEDAFEDEAEEMAAESEVAAAVAAAAGVRLPSSDWQVLSVQPQAGPSSRASTRRAAQPQRRRQPLPVDEDSDSNMSDAE